MKPTINSLFSYHTPTTVSHVNPPTSAMIHSTTDGTTINGQVAETVRPLAFRTSPPESSHTVKRHPPPAPQPTTPEDSIDPDKHKRTGFVFADAKQITGQIFTDQTGHFVVPSAAGNKYIFCLLDCDSSYIKPILLSSRTKDTLLAGFKTGVAFLTQAGLRPQLQRLDNEASKMLQNYMVENKIDYQLTPVGLHRRNHAERAIRTFKAYCIAGLASVDPDFPLNQWDKLVEQAEISLNLLRPSRINPRLSAYEQIHGRYDFNRTPLAPPGMKVLAHVRPEDRTSWGVRAFEGFYVGPARHHYRCYKIYDRKQIV